MRFQSALTIPAAVIALAATSLARPVVQPQPISPRVLSASEFASQIQARDDGGVDGTVSCRDMTSADINGLNDAQLLQLLQKINSMFSIPIYDLNANEASNCIFGTLFCDPNEHNIRKFRDAQFGGAGGTYQASYPDMNGKISTLGKDDLNQHIGLSQGQICLDATQITSTGFQAAEGTSCQSNTLKTYGTLTDAGQIQIQVTQGYSTSYTTTTESSTTIGKSLAIEVSFKVFGYDTKATGTLSYETTNTNGVEKGTENSSETQTSVQITPSPGQTCSMAIEQRTCPGSVDLSFPITTPSGYLRIEYFKVPCGLFEFCDYEDPPTKNGVDGPGQFVWYIPVSDLYSGISDLQVNQHVSTSLTTSGTYTESCSDADGSTPDGDTPSNSYVPSLTCPDSLGVLPSACDANLDDFLETGKVTGDTGVWGFNKAVYTQSPAAGSDIRFGQTNVVFNVSTPYHSKSCSALIQMAPPFSSTFEPESPVLELPQYGNKVSTEYRVGYVGTCDPQNQFGTCTVTNIQSRYDPDFTFKQTSNVGNPIQVFDFMTGANGFPEIDRYTFTLTCKDMYGSTGTVNTYQDAYRGDVATQTVAANTAIQTFHSTTKYLYTSVKTLYTSIVTPVAYKTLKTDTLYTTTVYTSTKTYTNFGAPRFSAKKTITLTETDSATKFKTIHPTVTPSTSLLTSTRTLHPTTTLTETSKKGVSTTKVTATKTHTKTVVRTAVPSTCPDVKRRDDNERIIGTTTIVDGTRTTTIADYTDTYTDELQATTTSTDALDFAQSTLASTSTVYDPFGTQITSGVKKAVKTRILNSYTITSTKKTTTTTTSTRTRTRTSPTTLRAATSTSVVRKTKPVTSTSLQFKPTSTSSVIVGTTTITSTKYSTITPACTPPAKKL